MSDNTPMMPKLIAHLAYHIIRRDADESEMALEVLIRELPIDYFVEVLRSILNMKNIDSRTASQFAADLSLGWVYDNARKAMAKGEDGVVAAESFLKQFKESLKIDDDHMIIMVASNYGKLGEVLQSFYQAGVIGPNHPDDDLPD